MGSAPGMRQAAHVMLIAGGEVGGAAAVVHGVHGGGHLWHGWLHPAEGHWAAYPGTVHPAAIW